MAVLLPALVMLEIAGGVMLGVLGLVALCALWIKSVEAFDQWRLERYYSRNPRRKHG
jgi:hypothetical protein